MGKSSQLQYRSRTNNWEFRFQGVKLGYDNVRSSAIFDLLLLVLYTPRGLYIYDHDLRFCVAANGMRTAVLGHAISSCSERNTNWSDGLIYILRKNDDCSNGCRRIAEVPLHHFRITEAVSLNECIEMQQAYNGVPMAYSSPASRGCRIQNVAREVDALLHPRSLISDPFLGLCSNWVRRSLQTAEYDWERDKL